MENRGKDGIFIKTHGMSDTYEYGIWGNILYRCNTPSSSHYEMYGGRGIRVCDEWLTFDGFIQDMGYRPSNDLSIDRIDVNGDYCKSNCRWATKKEQARNRRNTRFITYEGKDLSLEDFCDATKMSRHAVRSRFKRGWTSYRIVNTPVRSKYANN